METVGTCLKNKREANNISLKEVARITKITPIYLEHIEKNEFDKIPQGPYIKGYLSSYSRAVGCDVNKIINLYDSEHRKRARAEALQPAPASMPDGKHAFDKANTKRPKQQSSLRLGNLGSWYKPLVAFMMAKIATFKRAKKPIDTAGSPKPGNKKPFRQRVARVNQSDLGLTIHRWATDRRIWMYACIALFGTLILFLAGVGFYHLFLYDPDSITAVKAETTRDKETSPSSSIGSRPSIVASQSPDASRAADAPKAGAANIRLSESAKADPVVSGVKPEADISSARSVTSGPAAQIGAPSSDGSSTTQPAALLRDNAGKESPGPSDRQPMKGDLSPKPTIADTSPKVLQAAICRAIENRMPAGVDRSFPTTDGKIYVWTMIEAKQVPSKIHHIYYFGGNKISDVSLDVHSTRWRTWSSKTIANLRYRGEWRVDIAAPNGDVLRQVYFEVK